MGYAELIAKLQALPREKQAEVFDFVDFLAARCAAGGEAELPRGEWTEAEFRDLAMTQALRGMEDDPVSYDQGDIKERWL